MLENLPIPPEINEQTLQSSIMFECGLLTPLYSEPQTMRAAILQWFAERQWTFEHLVNIIKSKYSPIENTDRYEDLSESNIADITHSETMDRDYLREEERSSGEERNSGEDKSRAEEVNGTTDNDKHVSAYNTGDYAPTDSGSATSSTSMDTSESNKYSESNEYSESASFTESETDSTNRKIDDDRTHQLLRHVHGNIGVTTNQELIQQELALLQGFNIYNWIALNLRHSLFLEVW